MSRLNGPFGQESASLGPTDLRRNLRKGLPMSEDLAEPGSNTAERIELVRAYLESNLGRDLDMRAVASAAALSPFYLTRVFKARFGVPPYRYLIGLRIQRATELLLDSSLTVTQICHRVGFDPLSHFITTFRLQVGVSPSAYRRRYECQRDVGRFSAQTDALIRQPKRMNI